jgi:predicted dithiol-disulfide oxidoreductase (DUF899 family)
VTLKLPEIVSQREWESALEQLHAKEKAATRASDALAAERRRLPRVLVAKEYLFDGPGGRATLADLFEGRRQLLLYHFMFGPSQSEGCDGCSMFVDGVAHLSHLHERDTTFALVSRARFEKLAAYRRRMGWEIPWYSSARSDFNVDLGLSPARPQPEEYQDGETFGLSAFLREGDELYRTYFTSRRGVEALGSVWSLLDVAPLGRQERWEDSPQSYPQTPPYDWWRRHDEYPQRSR